MDAGQPKLEDFNGSESPFSVRPSLTDVPGKPETLDLA